MNEQEEIQSLINSDPRHPIVLASINTNMLPFHASILREHVQATVQQAANMEDYIEQQQILNAKLVSNGLVESVDQNLTVQLLKKQPGLPSSASILGLSPYYQFQPVKKFSAKTGSKIGNGEGDGYLEFQLRNYFGTGEKFVMDIQKGTKTKSSILVQYQQPFKVWYNSSVSFFQNNRGVGGLVYELSGFKVDVMSSYHRLQKTGSPWNHSLNMETCSRTTANTKKFRSKSLLFQCEEDWKNSLTYTLSKDCRNSYVSPTKGHLLKFSNEFEIGKLWNKTQMEVTKAHSYLSKVGREISLVSTFKGGCLTSFAKGAVPYIDKFQNGGGNDIRGFDFMGLGDKDRGDSLGGHYYVSYGLSLMVPFKPESNFKWHFFYNGGKLSNGPCQILAVSKHSSSVGVGVLFSHPAARFELNFTLPVNVSESDSTRKGFQYGLGMSFL